MTFSSRLLQNKDNVARRKANLEFTITARPESGNTVVCPFTFQKWHAEWPHE